MAHLTAVAEFPFPFLGQGDASYYEWFEMWIIFKDPVDTAMQRQLLEGAPEPCSMDASWPHQTLLWASSGDQFIQMHLIANYDEIDEDSDTECASEEAHAAFNADIERWLKEMHAKQPILFAARGEDAEAGGTQLGDWHHASVVMLREQVLPSLDIDAIRKAPQDSHLLSALHTAVAYLPDNEVAALNLPTD